MKNKKLRNVLISVCSAVVVGVLLLGISVAVGDAPGYDPPGAGVSPTFTGLTVTGNAQIAGSTAIYGDFIATGSANRFDGDLEVDGVLEVLETLVVSGFYGIRTSTPGDPDPVKVDDDLLVTGDIKTTGSVGSFYRKTSYVTGSYYSSISCNAGDYLTGCSGYHSLGLKYAYPSGVMCTAYGMGSGTARAYALCFDPQGVN